MNVFIEKFVDIAKTQLGITEQGGNNSGIEITKYQLATWLTPGGWPWCCAFIAWVLKEFLKDEQIRQHFGIKETETHNWRCRGANCNDWLAWAKKHGFYVTDESEPAKAGDIVIFDFSHIGIVTADQLPGKDYIETIEGNTNSKGSRDGDGVYLKTRKTNLVRNYIRFIA
jgi:hypothetical protein